MPVIKILPHPEYCPSGAEINAPAGTSICEALLENHINIEHACDMSRLSCQAIIAQKDLVVEIPKYSINHAKENH